MGLRKKERGLKDSVKFRHVSKDFTGLFELVWKIPSSLQSHPLSRAKLDSIVTPMKNSSRPLTGDVSSSLHFYQFSYFGFSTFLILFRSQHVSDCLSAPNFTQSKVGRSHVEL